MKDGRVRFGLQCPGGPAARESQPGPCQKRGQVIPICLQRFPSFAFSSLTALWDCLHFRCVVKASG